MDSRSPKPSTSKRTTEMKHLLSNHSATDLGPLFNSSVNKTPKVATDTKGLMKSCENCGSSHLIQTQHNRICRFCGAIQPKETGQQLKEKGLAQVSEHNENWMENCLKVAKWFVFQHGLSGEFTGEDIRLYCVTHGHIPQPKHPNAWGALISTLLKRKIIVPTGEYRAMKDNTSHARKTPVYKAS